MAAAKRVLRYLCSTSGMGLVLGGRRPVVLTGHADASWADDQATQWSSQGYTFSLGSGSVLWRSTRSSSVLSSSCEAEIYAGAMAAQELRWLTYLLTDLGEQPRSPPVLYVDNKAMLALCRENRLEHRTKHIALRYFLARELQQRGQLRLAYVAFEANTADIFTKALAPGDHQRFCTMLVRLELRERFRADLPILRLHSDRGGEFSSDLLRDLCRGKGITWSFMLPDSPKKIGIAERRIDLVMEVARTSMIHADASHFLWPFAVWYVVHRFNLWPRSGALVPLLAIHPRTSSLPALFLDSSLALPLTRYFTTPPRALSSSQDVTFDKLVPFYHLFPCRSAPPPPPPLFLAPGPPPVDPLPPQGPAPSGVSQVDPLPCTTPVEVAVGPGAASGGAASWGAEPRGAKLGGAGSAGASPSLSSQQLRTWLVRRARLRSGATGAGAAGAGGAGAGGTRGTTATGRGGARTRGTGAAGTGGVGGAGVGDPIEPKAAGAGGCGAGAGGAGVGGTRAGGAGAGEAGVVYPGGTSHLPLQPASPLPAPSSYTEMSGGLTERHEPASRPVLPVHTDRRVPHSRPPAVPGTHAMALRPSSVPLCVSLPAPPESSLPEVPDPESDRAHAATPTVSLLLATAITDPSFESATAPPSVGGECALGTDVLQDRQEDFECLAAAVPRFASMLLAREGDADAPDIPTPRSYAEAITGPYSSQWQAAMDAEMASWKSTCTYVDAVPPSRAKIKVKSPPGSPPAFKASYVARGFSQQQGVDYFQTFSPTPKMTTLRVLLHVTAQRDYELHSLDFSTAFLQGCLHKEI
ncbi:unnamed protein product [Closterium sp. NIES-54]